MEPTDEIGFPGSGHRSTTPHSRAKTSSVQSTTRGDTPPKIDKRLTQVYVSIICVGKQCET